MCKNKDTTIILVNEIKDQASYRHARSHGNDPLWPPLHRIVLLANKICNTYMYIYKSPQITLWDEWRETALMPSKRKAWEETNRFVMRARGDILSNRIGCCIIIDISL